MYLMLLIINEVCVFSIKKKKKKTLKTIFNFIFLLLTQKEGKKIILFFWLILWVPLLMCLPYILLVGNEELFDSLVCFCTYLTVT